MYLYCKSYKLYLLMEYRIIISKIPILPLYLFYLFYLYLSAKVKWESTNIRDYLWYNNGPIRDEYNN